MPDRLTLTLEGDEINAMLAFFSVGSLVGKGELAWPDAVKAMAIYDAIGDGTIRRIHDKLTSAPLVGEWAMREMN